MRDPQSYSNLGPLLHLSILGSAALGNVGLNVLSVLLPKHIEALVGIFNIR